jgi:hypothetical protein
LLTAAFPFHAHLQIRIWAKLLGNREHGPHELRDLTIALAGALPRSKFRACPLDPKPQSLIGCDKEPIQVVLKSRVLLRKAEGRFSCFGLIFRKC